MQRCKDTSHVCTLRAITVCVRVRTFRSCVTVCVCVHVCVCVLVHTCSGHNCLKSLEVHGLHVIHTFGQTVCQFDLLLLLHIRRGRCNIMQHTLCNATAHLRMHICEYVSKYKCRQCCCPMQHDSDSYVRIHTYHAKEEFHASYVCICVRVCRVQVQYVYN